MGTNVDVYQRAEGRYRLMPGILAALRDFANPFSILTKGTLILRDLELLQQAASVTTVGLSMSVGFVDEAVWRSVESGTPSPRRRLDAVRALTDAGFDVGVLMAPILPGITDTDESIDATVKAIAGAGACSVVPLPLHLRPGAREWYLQWLARERPHLVRHYRELFARGPGGNMGSYQPDVAQREIAATGAGRGPTLRHRHQRHAASARGASGQAGEAGVHADAADLRIICGPVARSRQIVAAKIARRAVVRRAPLRRLVRRLRCLRGAPPAVLGGGCRRHAPAHTPSRIPREAVVNPTPQGRSR